MSDFMKKIEAMEAEMSRLDKAISWYYTHIRNPISELYYGLRQLPRNIKRWWPVLWGYREWDSVYTLKALRIGLEGQYDQFDYALNKRGWYHVGIEKNMKNIKICIELIKRIEKDDYCLIEYKVFKNKKHMYNRMASTEKYDVEYLTEKLKDIRYWWD